jgi:hypothetical protein
VDLARRIIPLVEGHPAVRSIRLAGSRADGRASKFSDWDFLVETDNFTALGEALPQLLAPLNPLAQQWDRLSREWCWMLILRGPTKVDLIFPDKPHVDEPPWEPSAENLDAIETHFWDWMLWLRGKQAGGKVELSRRGMEMPEEHPNARAIIDGRWRACGQAVAAVDLLRRCGPPAY